MRAVFDNTVLMVGAYPTECYILIFAIYSFNKTIVGKSAIAGVVAQDGPTRLGHGFPHCCFCQQCLCYTQISHEVNVNEITYVVVKRCNPQSHLFVQI